MQLFLSGDLVDINRLAKKYHYGAEDIEQLANMWEEVYFCIAKNTQYVEHEGKSESGYVIEVNHRMVTRGEYDKLPLESAELMAMTLGDAVDQRQNTFLENENLTAAYMMECICNEVLLSLYEKLNQQYAKEYGCYIKRYHFIGEKVPIEEMPKVLAMLDQNQISCNEYGVLLPKKSVVFFAETTEQQEEECRGICQYCTRADCPNKSGEGFHLTYGYQKIFGNR